MNLILPASPACNGEIHCENDAFEEMNIQPPDRDRFNQLAYQWEKETVLLSSTSQAIKHPIHQTIVSMGEPVVPLILERMRETGGHWDHALADITGANPVKRSDWGNISAMQASWLEWGKANGYI